VFSSKAALEGVLSMADSKIDWDFSVKGASIPCAPSDTGAPASIKLTIESLLQELREPIATGWLEAGADLLGTRAALIAAIDEQQLMVLVGDVARQGLISPDTVASSSSSELSDDLMLTPAQKKLLRDALARRIDERVHDIDENRSARIDRDGHRLAEKQAAGRYTLAEAARAIAIASAMDGDRQRLLGALRHAASSMALPVYSEGKTQRRAQDQMPALQDVEAYWDDLNKWLDEHEPRIGFRFPELPSKANARLAADPKSRERRDILDPVIDRAIDAAGATDTAAVWLQLKELALSSTSPFDGTIEVDGSLSYTSIKNTKSLFAKDALAKRLKRRGSGAP
jgi:hypothetical protein